MTYARHNPYDLDAEELHAGPPAFVCPCCGESGFKRDEDARVAQEKQLRAMIGECAA